MEYKHARERIEGAMELLTAQSIDWGTFESTKKLLHGINPRIDKLLDRCEEQFGHIGRLHKGEVIELAVEATPEETEKDKKRKKYLLVFLKFWRELKEEVERVQAEVDDYQKYGDRTGSGKAPPIGKRLGVAKGPLGIITLIAGGFVLLQTTAVRIVIKNNGCDPI